MITQKNEEIELVFPEKISGFTENSVQGFMFKSVAQYHNRNLEDDFYSSVFNKKYNNYENTKKIKALEEFSEAVTGARIDNFDDCWENNIKKFIQKNCISKKSIMEIDTSIQMGNTLGEMSL